MIALQN